MGTTPQTGAPEWEHAQASPWLTANKARRTFDAFALRTSVIDRDLTAPPATCSDGARYLVAATATGDWATHDGQLAIAFGTNASNGWVFATAANEGVQIWVEDEETQIEYVNGQWVLSPDQIRFFGDLADVDLTGLNDGDQVYYDASNMQWYPAPPLSGSQPAGGTTGQVLTKQSDTSGDVFWDTMTLNDLGDVDLGGGLNDGDQLLWDSSNAQWYPSAPAAGGGAGSSPWELVSTYTYSGPVANVDFTNLGDYTDVLLICRNVTLDASGLIGLRVSIDNGASFYSTSGDYLNLNTTGAPSNQTYATLGGGSTAGTLRTATSLIPGINVDGAPKLMDQTLFQRMFVASNSPINAIRFGAFDTGANLAGGTIYVLGRA